MFKGNYNIEEVDMYYYESLPEDIKMFSSYKIRTFSEVSENVNWRANWNLLLLVLVFLGLLYCLNPFLLVSKEQMAFLRQGFLKHESMLQSLRSEVKGLKVHLEDSTRRMKELQKELDIYKNDGTRMMDYALESSGATVISSLTSDTYVSNSDCVMLFGFPISCKAEKSNTIIQPEVSPGKCWAFQGNKGFATIALAHPVHITHVTLEHLPRELSTDEHINNAPKEFSIYGMRHESDEGTLLGMFFYNYEGNPIQTFKVMDSGMEQMRLVQLKVNSNWGHPHHTCIYRLRVHSQPEYKKYTYA